ncbi:MAG: VOC family protein [Hasllibacter sp.]
MTPYLTFGGDCADAFARYEGIFGGTLAITRYSDAPPEAQPPGGAGDGVMHAELRGDGWAVMGADRPPSGGPLAHGGSVMHLAADPDDAVRIHAALAEGGAVVMPVARTFWSPAFGMARDAHGIGWMISVPA